MKTVEEILKRSALNQYQNKFLVDVEDMDWIVGRIAELEARVSKLSLALEISKIYK